MTYRNHCRCTASSPHVSLHRVGQLQNEPAYSFISSAGTSRIQLMKPHSYHLSELHENTVLFHLALTRTCISFYDRGYLARIKSFNNCGPIVLSRECHLPGVPYLGRLPPRSVLPNSLDLRRLSRRSMASECTGIHLRTRILKPPSARPSNRRFRVILVFRQRGALRSPRIGYADKSRSLGRRSQLCVAGWDLRR